MMLRWQRLDRALSADERSARAAEREVQESPEFRSADRIDAGVTPEPGTPVAELRIDTAPAQQAVAECGRPEPRGREVVRRRRHVVVARVLVGHRGDGEHTLLVGVVERLLGELVHVHRAERALHDLGLHVDEFLCKNYLIRLRIPQFEGGARFLKPRVIASAAGSVN